MTTITTEAALDAAARTFGTTPSLPLESVSAVDPAQEGRQRLRGAFLIDLDRPAETVVARHHRKAARKALRSLTIEVYDPSTELDTWCALYTRLVEKHRAEGIRAFSPASFAKRCG